MATSKPVYQNYVYQNGSLYCALYKRRVINTSGTGADQWYWMPTNQSGDIIDFRANALNAGATYTSEANALANIPSGYGAPAVDRWKSDKYMSLLNMFPFDAGSSDKFKLGITDWTSNVVGLNNIVIPIYWTDVFDSYNSTGRRQDQNLTGSWSKVDDILIFCKNTGRKISLIVSMHLSSRIIDSVSKFYGTSNYEKDEWGNPIAVGDYGNGHPSLADETTGSGLSMMKDFFQKVVARYGGTTGQTYSLGAQLNWIATTITGQNEFGYNYENTVSGLTAKALSGYSPATISGFRTWVSTNVNNPKRYANKDLMNAAWGTNFSDFSTATAPTTGKAFGTATVNDFAGLFYSNWGKDFWRYLTYLLYKFTSDCRAIVAANTSTYAPQAKFIVSFGGASPNDDFCGMRGTWDVIAWGENSDGIKTAFGIDTRNPNTAITLDYMQNYPGKKMTELHWIDFTDDKSPESTSIVKQRMFESGKSAIQNGCTDLLFITMPKHGTFYDMTKDLFADLRTVMNQNNDSARQTGNRVASISLGEIMNSNGSTGLSNWKAAGGNNSDRVKFTFSNTINPSTSDLPYTLSLFDDVSTYYFRQNEMKNSYFINNPSVQSDYITNKVGVLVSSHGITYQVGTKTRSNITVKSKTTGVVWLKMIQNRGVTNTENNGAYANNHPEIRDLPFLTEDCRFWFPLDDYDIIIDVFDATCYFSVMNPNNDAPNRFVSEYNVTASTQSTITVLKSTMLTQSDMDWRLIKINNNRNFSTP